MDMRMARYCGYPDVDAPKRLHDEDSNVISSLQHTVLLADLWAIQALTRRFDGIELSLDADHLWLKVDSAKPSSGALVPWHDELTEHLVRVGNATFAPGWLDDQ
jgi:hypothetical protein